MEVLDVWKNLNSQVNAITKKQISVFPDTLKPKTQRDLEVEVNVDKSVESLNNLLESHLGNLEFVLRNDKQLRTGVITTRPTVVLPKPEPPVRPASVDVMTKEKRAEQDRKYDKAMDKYKKDLSEWQKKTERESETEKLRIAERGTAQLKLLPFQNAYQDTINVGSVVSLWNNIVRYYQKQGLSRQSQEMVKVKVQDLIPNLEAIIYGMGQAVDVLFSTPSFSNSIGMKILEMLRSQSVYQLIKTQIDSTSFEIISVSAMETVFRNIFTSLSEERRDLLDEVSARGDITSTPIRKIPNFSSENFQERIKAVADELGIKISEIPTTLLQKLKALNKEDFEKYVDSAIRDVVPQRERIEEKSQLGDFLESINVFARDVSSLKLREWQLPQMIRISEQNIELLEGDFKEDLPIIEDEVEVPLAPAEPNRSDYPNEDSYNDALAEYSAKRQSYLTAVMRNLQIQNDSELRQIIRSDDDVLLKKTIANEQRRIQELKDEQGRIREKIRSASIEVEEAIERFAGVNEDVRDQLEDYFETRVYAFTGSLQQTKGKGMPVDSRGLAGMGSHYGVDESDSESESESGEESEEEDALDYDDKRNEMYYSRPARRR